MDIANLPDEELREQLIGYGVKVGPIVSSTRLFYEKKLARLIDSGGAPPPQPETESEEEEEEEDEEDAEEEEQITYKQEPRVYSQPAPTQQRTQVPAGYTPITKQRQASPTRVTQRNVTSTTQAPKQTSGSAPDKKTAKKSGGIALWIKLLFVIIVAVLMYLVIINVNPSAQNKIPMDLDGDF